MTPCVISFYPLSAPFKDRMEREVGPVSGYLTIHTRKSQRLLALIGEVRSLRARQTIIAIEQESGRAFASPLFLLALLRWPNPIFFFWPDGTLEAAKLARAIAAVVAFINAQIASRVALASYLRLARRLVSRARAGRSLRFAGRGSGIAYLDANLSGGLVAGGSVGHTQGVIDAFVGYGFSVDYLSLKSILEGHRGVRWIEPPRPALLAFPAEMNYFVFNRQFEKCAASHVASARPAFFYQRLSQHNFSGALLKLEFSLPLVVEYNGSDVWAAKNWGEPLALHDAGLAFERCLLLSADLIVTVAAPLVDEVLALGVPRDRVLLQPNCIDPELFSPKRFSQEQRDALRARLGIGSDARIATFIGTFGTWHGVDFLADAIVHLVDAERAYLDRNKLHFMLVGDGLMMPKVRERLGTEPYRRYVTLTGLIPQHEAPAHLAASDIFLSPHLPNKDGSEFFGSPTKLFEYMAMERPIVAAELDQIGKVLRGSFFEGEPAPRPLAALFAPGDLEAMLAAFRWVVDHPDRAQLMAADARREALARYTWSSHVGAIINRMKDLGMLEPATVD